MHRAIKYHTDKLHEYQKKCKHANVSQAFSQQRTDQFGQLLGEFLCCTCNDCGKEWSQPVV